MLGCIWVPCLLRRLGIVLSLRAGVQVVGVDDEQPVRYSTKSLLNTEGYQVV
jgi:hypothetical protein